MVARNSPEGIPKGWTVHCKVLSSGRKLKYYTDPKTGKKFYSKNEVYEYIYKGGQRVKGQSSSRKLSSVTKKKTLHGCTKMNKHLTWPPKGWLTEIKQYEAGPDIGKLYKIYIDKSTGHKFYSKPQVLQYLKEQKDKRCMVGEIKKVVVTRSKSCPYGNKSEAKTEECLNNVKLGTHSPDKKKKTSTAKTQRLATDVVHPQTSADIGTYVSRSLSICDIYTNGVQTRGSKRRQPLDLNDRCTSSSSANLLVGGISPNGKRDLHCGYTSGKTRGSSTLPSRFSKRLAGVEPEVEAISSSNNYSPSARAKRSGRDQKAMALLKLENMKIRENGYESMSVTEVDLDLKEESKVSVPKGCSTPSQYSEGNKGSLSCRRFSKRLAGLEPGLGAVPDLTEKAVRDAGKISFDDQPLTRSAPALNCIVFQACQQTSVDVQQSQMSRGLTDKRKSKNGLKLNKSHNIGSIAGSFRSKIHSELSCRRYSKRLAGAEAEVTLDSGGEAQSQQAITSQVVFPPKVEEACEDQGTPQQNPIWHLLSDPCLEFAFKTLTGEIPIEDDLQIQSYFQQIKKPSQKDVDPNSESAIRYVNSGTRTR